MINSENLRQSDVNFLVEFKTATLLKRGEELLPLTDTKRVNSEIKILSYIKPIVNVNVYYMQIYELFSEQDFTN